MRVDIVICTWNRAKLLDQTLAKMRNLDVPHDTEWKVTVVNNGCTDDTDAVVERHLDQLPLARLWEPKLGKSNALNTAVAQLDSDLVLWTDDDVLVDDCWLTSYVEAARAFPEASYFGGPIHPWYEVDPPEWLQAAGKYAGIVYAARQFGDEQFEFSGRNLPFGANFAIRTEVQKRYPYNCRLGRVGANDVRGEEVEMLQQLLNDGLRGYWVPTAGVQHFIPQHRMTLKYFREFFFGMGETRSLIELENWRDGRSPAMRQTYLWSKARFYDTQHALLKQLAGPRSWVPKLCKASYYEGRHARLTAEFANGPQSKAA